jgi:hypothetical protein
MDKVKRCKVVVINMFRYPSFIYQTSLDMHPIDTGCWIPDTGSMYRCALSFKKMTEFIDPMSFRVVYIITNNRQNLSETERNY